MFLGGFEHVPNVDAARFLVREVMPRVWCDVPRAEVLLVGSDPTPEVLALAGERVTVTGYVPDLAPWFGRSRMTLSALRYGSGLKGKIVASLEAGVPVVTTAIGNEGLDLRDGVEALLGETPDELAAAATRLFTEPGLAGALAAAGSAWLAGHLTHDAARTALLAAFGPCRAAPAR
jgi:O-antigen biosynthesis protein